jgi:hypothetical protein
MNNTAFRNALSHRAQREPGQEISVEKWRETMLFSTQYDQTGEIDNWLPHSSLQEVDAEDLPRTWFDEGLYQRESQKQPEVNLDRNAFYWKRRFFAFPRDLYPHMNPNVGICLTQQPLMREPRMGLFALQELGKDAFVGFCTGEWALEESFERGLGDLNRCVTYYQNTFEIGVMSVSDKVVLDGSASMPGVNCSSLPKDLHRLAVVPRFSSQAHARLEDTAYEEKLAALNRLRADRLAATNAPTLHAKRVEAKERELARVPRPKTMHRGLCMPYASSTEAADIGLLCYSTFEVDSGGMSVLDQNANCAVSSMLVRPSDDTVAGAGSGAQGALGAQDGQSAAEPNYNRAWDARLHAAIGIWTTAGVPRGYELISCCAAPPEINELALAAQDDLNMDGNKPPVLSGTSKTFDTRKSWAKLNNVVFNSKRLMRTGFAAAVQMSAWNSALRNPQAGLVQRAHCGPAFYVALCKNSEFGATYALAESLAVELAKGVGGELPGVAMVTIPGSSNTTNNQYFTGLSYAVMQAEGRRREERAEVFASYNFATSAADAASREKLELYTRILLGKQNLMSLIDPRLSQETQFRDAVAMWARAQSFCEEIVLLSATEEQLANTPLARRRNELLLLM